MQWPPCCLFHPLFFWHESISEDSTSFERGLWYQECLWHDKTITNQSQGFSFPANQKWSSIRRKAKVWLITVCWNGAGLKYWIGLNSAIGFKKKFCSFSWFFFLPFLFSTKQSLSWGRKVSDITLDTWSGDHFLIMALASDHQMYQTILSRYWQSILFCCTINKMSLFKWGHFSLWFQTTLSQCQRLQNGI